MILTRFQVAKALTEEQEILGGRGDKGLEETSSLSVCMETAERNRPSGVNVMGILWCVGRPDPSLCFSTGEFKH